MSGGSLDYIFTHVYDAARTIEIQARTPLHRAFAAHLGLVAGALHDMELVLSGDASEGSETEAIRAVLPEAAELEAATRMANEALVNLKAVLWQTGDSDGE